MLTRYTEVDFKRLSWHDCQIWRLDFLAGDSDDKVPGWTDPEDRWQRRISLHKRRPQV